MNNTIKFWGIKGSCPGAGEFATCFGSNTSCVEISNEEELIILDAGSGIVFLGQAPYSFASFKRISIFISHYHYDHIIGLPFFSQAYNPKLTFHIYGMASGTHTVETAIKGLFTPPYLPMPFEALQAKIEFHTIQSGDVIPTLFGSVTAMATDHPGGNLAYRVDFGGRRLSYMTDLEHAEAINESLTEFVRDSDYLYYDANFTDEEYHHGKYEGWGHSTPTKGMALREASSSKLLLIGHHALHRLDAELDALQSLHPIEHVQIAYDFMSFKWEDDHESTL